MHILSALKILREPTALFMCLLGAFPAYSAWLTILVYQQGLTFNDVLWAQGIAQFVVAAVFILACVFAIHGSRLLTVIVPLIPVTAIIGLITLAPSAAGYFALFVLALASITFMVAANYAVALPVIQSGINREMNLAVIMMALPTVSALAYAGFAVLAEVHVSLVHIAMCAVLIAMSVVMFVRNRPVKLLPTPVKLKGKVPFRAITVLLANLIYAGPYYILKGVLIPLYLYEKLDGNFAKVGLVLSFLCLIAMVSRKAQSKAKEEGAPTKAIVLVSLLMMVVAFTVWGFSESVWVATAMLTLHTLAHRLYAFGILSELQKSDPVNYAEHTKLKEIYQHVVGGICFVVSALYATSVLENYDTLLFLFAAGTVLSGIVFAIGARQK